jgi:ATP-dependent DNA helicase Rep
VPYIEIESPSYLDRYNQVKSVVEEERRLAYVGITRAQQTLTFSLCRERRQFGELIRPEPSRFLAELPQDDVLWEKDKPKLTVEQKQQQTSSQLDRLRAILKG